MENGSAEKLSAKRAIAYALPAFSLAIIGIPVYIYIPKFYTDSLGISITFVGAVLLISRIFDAITDPVIGFISDRTTSKMGRRRPYIAFGSIFLAISLLFLFNPFSTNHTINSIWFTFFIITLFLFWTIVVVPYESLGPEITFDYNERSKLFGLRDGLLIAGTLFAAATPALVELFFDIDISISGERKKFMIISLFYAPLLIFSSLYSIYIIKEKKVKIDKSKLFSSIKSIRRNRPFLILLSSFTISSIGSNLPAALILYYVQYVLKSDKADLFLFLYFITGVIFLPLWIIVSQKIGKKRSWIITMSINTGSFLAVFFLGAGDTALYAFFVFLSGIGFGATLAIPSAIQADVIDYDQLLSGKRQEGQYVGIWSICKKLAAAFGVGLSFIVLGLLDYKPNIEQSKEVVMAIRIMYALIPCLFNFIAILIALKFPITKSVHEKILQAIEQKKQGLTIIDPLV